MENFLTTNKQRTMVFSTQAEFDEWYKQNRTDINILGVNVDYHGKISVNYWIIK